MNKIPVWRSVASAYSFAFGNLATIIGLSWLPTAIICVTGYFAVSRYFDGLLMAIANGNRYAAYHGTGYFYLYRIGTLLLEAVVAVSIMRQAFRPRARSVFVQFHLGATELRMFGAFVAATLVLLTIEILGVIFLVITALALGYAARTTGTVDGIPAPVLALSVYAVLVLAVVGTLVFINTRLTFFLVAATVAENRIDLVHYWEMTRGNFWRAFLILLMIGFPVWMLYLGVQLGFVGFAATGDAPNLSPMGISLSGSIRAAAMRMHRVLAWLPYFYGAWFLVRPLTVGLASGGAAAAYRALVPEAAAVSTPLGARALPVTTS